MDIYQFFKKIIGWNPYSVVVNFLDCDIVVNQESVYCSSTRENLYAIKQR